MKDIPREAIDGFIKSLKEITEKSEQRLHRESIPLQFILLANEITVLRQVVKSLGDVLNIVDSKETKP